MSTTQFEEQDLAVHVWDTLYFSLIPLPAALLGAVLISDVLFWSNADPLWTHVSEWLLGAGLATGALSAAEGLICYVTSGGVRPSRACWIHVVGNLLALLLSASNLIYRLNEGPGDTIVPAGIALTAVAVCLLAGTAYLGGWLAPDLPSDETDDWHLL